VAVLRCRQDTRSVDKRVHERRMNRALCPTCNTGSLSLTAGPRLSLLRALLSPRETLDKPWLRLKREDSASYTELLLVFCCGPILLSLQESHYSIYSAMHQCVCFNTPS